MRFKIEQSKNKPNHWVCSDFENKIVCIFENGKFNETQKYDVLEDVDLSPVELAKIAREMADWLRNNHYDKIFLDIREVFGKNLSRIRNKKNISIRELAVLSGLNKSTIVNIEKGRFACTLDVQYKLATGLGIGIEELFKFREGT